MSLKALLEKRKAEVNGTSAGNAGLGSQPAGSSPVAQVVEERAAPIAQTPQVAQPSTPGKLNFLGKKPVAASQAPVEPKATVAESVDDMDLSNLGETSLRQMSGFSDETPASAPARELPPECEPAMKQFVQMMDSVYNILDDAEMLGQVIRNIMIELKTYPHYAKMISPDDVRVWIRSMRQTMGLAKIKKQEKSTARKTGAASRGKSKALDDDMAGALADLGIDLSDM